MEKQKFIDLCKERLLRIDALVDSYNRDSSCERFTDEELQMLLCTVGEMEPIVYEIEERNMLKRTIAESDFCTIGTPF